MTKKQVIVSVLGGGGEAEIRRYSTELHEEGKVRGHNSTLVTIHAEKDERRTKIKQKEIWALGAAFEKLDGESRVYLDGHGDWENATLSGVTAGAMVDLLKKAHMPKVRVVSICGCSLGRDKGTANSMRVSNSMTSFAAQLHRGLKTNGSDVYARVYDTFSGSDIAAEMGDEEPQRDGRKFTGDSVEDAKHGGHGREDSKYRFFWKDGKQMREAIDYEAKKQTFGRRKGPTGLF